MSQGRTRSRSLADESLVAALEQLGLELLHGLGPDAHHDQDARAPEPQRLHAGDVADERRHDGDDPEEQRAGDRDPRHDTGQELGGRAAGADAGDEPAVALDVVGDVIRHEREGRVEERERDDEHEVGQVVEDRVLKKATIVVETLRSHSVSLVVKYCATWLGSSRIEIAKIIGITPALFTRSGMKVLPPEYIRVPRTRFAYCTGTRRWPS